MLLSNGVKTLPIIFLLCMFFVPVSKYRQNATTNRMCSSANKNVNMAHREFSRVVLLFSHTVIKLMWLMQFAIAIFLISYFNDSTAGQSVILDDPNIQILLIMCICCVSINIFLLPGGASPGPSIKRNSPYTFGSTT